MPISTSEPPLVFISYTKKDFERVNAYYSELRTGSYDLWMDAHKLKGGQNWDFEIKRALSRASLIVAFFSENSITKRGYVQRELKLALDKYSERLADDIYIIPVFLNDTEIPDQIKGVQALFDSDKNCISDLRSSIVEQLNRLGEITESVQSSHDLKWSLSEYKSEWEGLPGYEARYQLIRFSSQANPQVHEITYLIHGYLAQLVMDSRRVMFSQNSDTLNFGQGKFWRTNILDANHVSTSIVENIATVKYAIYTFNGGAAHGYSQTKFFNFIIHPTIIIDRVEQLFTNPNEAFQAVQSAARTKLLELRLGGGNEEPFALDKDWVEQGTERWEQFAAFSFSDKGLVIAFDPYQVAAFAFGTHRVTLEWRLLRPMFERSILCALGREFEHFDEKSPAERAAFRDSLGASGTEPSG